MPARRDHDGRHRHREPDAGRSPNLLSSLTADQERGCIFSVVNTLTAYAGVNRVQFLVEGVKVDSLAGALSLRSPLVRNPGIIQTSLS